MKTKTLPFSLFTLGVTLLLLGAYPQFSHLIAPVIASMILVGFIMWLDRKKHDDLKDIKDQLKVLREKIEVLQIRKGLGQ